MLPLKESHHSGSKGSWKKNTYQLFIHYLGLFHAFALKIDTSGILTNVTDLNNFGFTLAAA